MVNKDVVGKWTIYDYDLYVKTQIPNQGEITFFDNVFTGLINTEVSKIGDGATTIENLPFREILQIESDSNVSLVDLKIKKNHVTIKNTHATDTISINIGTIGAPVYAYLLAGSILEYIFDGTSWLSPVPAEPVGKVSMFGGAAAPSGYLLCDGAAISRSTYAGLFAVIGTTFGVGNGTTTFNVPDFQGIFPRGAGTSTKLSNASGNPFAGVLGTYQNDKMQSHKARMQAYGNNQGASTAFNSLGPRGAASATYDSISLVADADGAPRTGTETNPANLGINFIIKT